MAKQKQSNLSVPNASNIAQFTLRNGIRVFAYENFASPAVVLSGYMHVGARDESPARAGLASFTTDCLTRGTASHTYEQIFEQTESIGANLSVSAAMHTTSLYAKSLAEDFGLMTHLLSEVVRQPTFPETELEKERAEWLSGLEERANSTRAMCGLAFNELCYPEGHPYHDTTDNAADMAIARSITRDEVVNFYRRYFSPQDMVVVVSGAIHANDARDKIAAAFGDWQATRPTRAEMPSAPKISGVQRKHISMPGKSQTNVLWSYPSLPRTHPDWLAAGLMNSILGQFGMYGRMGESVRKEEGLVYYIGSRFEGGPGPGSWNCYAGTNPKTVDRVIEISRNEVKRIQDKKVKPHELEDNQLYFTGVMPLQLETNEGICSGIINMLRYDLGLDYMQRYPEMVHAVRAADIQRVAQTWLDADNFVLATAGA